MKQQIDAGKWIAIGRRTRGAGCRALVALAAACLLSLPIAAVAEAAGGAAGELENRQPESGVAWGDLPERERAVLAPYAERWDSFSGRRQQRLSKGAQRWLQMDDRDRETAKAQFQRWQQLPVEQRERIRERYRQFKRLPEARQQRLRETYQRFRNLPPDKRRDLRQRWRSQPANREPESRASKRSGNELKPRHDMRSQRGGSARRQHRPER